MKKNEVEIYQRLFDYVSNNMKDKDRVLPFSATTLYISSLSDNRTINYEDIINLNIVEFVRAIYLNLFLRFPEEGIIESLPSSFNSKDEEMNFKNNYLEMIILSTEARMNGAKVFGYTVSSKNKIKLFLYNVKAKIFGVIYNKIWVKIPKSFRLKLRKIMGR